MLKLVSLLAVVAYASAGILPEFIRFPRLDGRIVGGSPTTIQQHPYQISLQYYGSHICGGSLISENQIVTAAHCLEGRTARTLQVRAGCTNRITSGVIVDVAEIKMNPSYDPYDMSNDIGIVTLATPVQFSDSIQPIPLARENPAPNTQAVTSGWGVLNEGSYGLPTELREVTVDIVSHEQCQKSYGNYDIT
uniref:Peptidase S1 domain-containing protein n=1 Tax=Megaselia scalaris TaxID=36166 RepID=T1GQB9_MEGSC